MKLPKVPDVGLADLQLLAAPTAQGAIDSPWLVILGVVAFLLVRGCRAAAPVVQDLIRCRAETDQVKAVEATKRLEIVERNETERQRISTGLATHDGVGGPQPGGPARERAFWAARKQET